MSRGARDPDARHRQTTWRRSSRSSSRCGAPSPRSSTSSCCRRSRTPAATWPASTTSDRLMGASFGFLARHHGQQALHSHVTGILPGLQHGGVGRAMKLHQRDWAAERDIAVDHMDVRPARAPQRLVQHRGARRPRLRVPRQLLRTDDRLDQRPRRVRPAGGRVAHRSGRGTRLHRRRQCRSSRSPRLTTSSCSAAPTPAKRSSGVGACARSSASGSPPVPSSPGSHATGTTYVHLAP